MSIFKSFVSKAIPSIFILALFSFFTTASAVPVSYEVTDGEFSSGEFFRDPRAVISGPAGDGVLEFGANFGSSASSVTGLLTVDEDAGSIDFFLNWQLQSDIIYIIGNDFENPQVVASAGSEVSFQFSTSGETFISNPNTGTFIVPGSVPSITDSLTVAGTDLELTDFTFFSSGCDLLGNRSASGGAGSCWSDTDFPYFSNLPRTFDPSIGLTFSVNDDGTSRLAVPWLYNTSALGAVDNGSLFLDLRLADNEVPEPSTVLLLLSGLILLKSKTVLRKA